MYWPDPRLALEPIFVEIASKFAWNMKIRNRWIIVFCLLAGCKQAHPPASAAAAKIQIEAAKMEGKTITIQDKALNSKAGAMVGAYFVEGLHSWPDDALNKTVAVTGQLKTVEHAAEDLRAPDGSISQGMVGTQYILTEPKWNVVKE